MRLAMGSGGGPDAGAFDVARHPARSQLFAEVAAGQAKHHDSVGDAVRVVNVPGQEDSGLSGVDVAGFPSREPGDSAEVYPHLHRPLSGSTPRVTTRLDIIMLPNSATTVGAP